MKTKRPLRNALPWVANRLCPFLAALLVFFILPDARGASLPAQTDALQQSLALARYLASLENGNLFERSGPVAISIEASLPGLYKGASLLAIRDHDESGGPKYYLLALGGDGTVLAEVISRYFAAQQMEHVPAFSTAITPVNYKFRFLGEVSTSGTSAYIYRITPKKRRPGLLKGQVWMDSGSGAELMLTGRVAELSSVDGSADLVRETRLRNGSPSERVTHAAFALPNLGRAELVITESLLRPEGGGTDIETTLSALVH